MQARAPGGHGLWWHGGEAEAFRDGFPVVEESPRWQRAAKGIWVKDMPKLHVFKIELHHNAWLGYFLDSQCLNPGYAPCHVLVTSHHVLRRHLCTGICTSGVLNQCWVKLIVNQLNHCQPLGATDPEKCKISKKKHNQQKISQNQQKKTHTVNHRCLDNTRCCSTQTPKVAT